MRQQDDPPILQLGPEFYDPVQPASFPKKQLRYWNDSLNLEIDKDRLWDFEPLANNLPSPLALRYHGHQFQHYNPELGDGRGFLYAQIKMQNQWHDLGTKGSGTTPYSRRGDGRLTLKGAMREALATEMLESLGVKTSKTVCFYETGEKLIRGDEPSPTRSAVLTRFTLGHIRIGTFQRLAYFKQIENIKKLTLYCMRYYYSDEEKKIDTKNELLVASRFLQLVVHANAKLVAQVMMGGFVHGVLNTDNINISGELFDYGPYRFIPNYDPLFTAAYFDEQGLYSFGRQPAAFLWNLHQLADALKVAHPELPTEEILASFPDTFNESVHSYFIKRLNLKKNNQEKTSELISLFFKLMEEKKLPFEKTFFDFNSLKVLDQADLRKNYEVYGDVFKNLVEKLHEFEVADKKIADHAYFKQPAPTTLLIDEIETIWKSIAENDDWSLFNHKLQSIRLMRGLYG
ncbi:MAG: YdiU family protein [Bdellovibrio sp.]|nr:YdiU family protein [Bdellovibrio sp.]